MKNIVMFTAATSIVFLAAGCQNQQGSLSNEHNYVTTTQPIILFSLNDGEVPSILPHLSTEDNVRDSITAIRLFKDRPPVSRTVYGTAPSSILGSPRTAIIGRYGIVTNHDDRGGLKVPPEIAGPNQIVAVDLESDDLRIVSRVELARQPWLALAHPDGKRLIVAFSELWGIYEVKDDGALIEVSQSPSPGVVSSFDVSNDGKTIIATMAKGDDPLSSKLGIFHFVMNEDNRIVLVGELTSDKYAIDGPFSPRISPDGKRALVLNSNGWSDGVLDDVLVLDLTPDVKISQSIKQVADGLESLAIHPSGEFAVVTCLDFHGQATTSHLAIIDLKGEEAQLLYYIPIELVPEGIEFTPDGTKLFVGSTRANHILVYDVRGMNLYRSPYVLPTGYGHSALALSPN